MPTGMYGPTCIFWASLTPFSLQPDTLRLLSEHEEHESVGWRNYRKTHSDGLRYGDLDPRFLEHALEPSDVATPLCVNPTTRLGRKHNFDRNNLDAAGALKQPAASEVSPACRSTARTAQGESVIKCPSPLKVLKDTYDHSCY